MMLEETLLCNGRSVAFDAAAVVKAEETDQGWTQVTLTVGPSFVIKAPLGAFLARRQAALDASPDRDQDPSPIGTVDIGYRAGLSEARRRLTEAADMERRRPHVRNALYSIAHALVPRT